MEATITRSHGGPEQFTVTLNPRAGSRPRVLTTDRQGLYAHLREWKLGERTIVAILNVPRGITISVEVGILAGPREGRSPALVA